MKITTIEDPAVAWAEKLWGQLAADLMNAHKTIIEIISSRAWEPLGYKTFADAWQARMKDITLASELRPHVVFQMIDEGLTADEISDLVKGVGPEMAKDHAAQKENNVPPHLVITRRRNQPLPYGTLFIHIPTRRLAAWRRAAKKDGTTVEQIALAQLDEYFKGVK